MKYAVNQIDTFITEFIFAIWHLAMDHAAGSLALKL